jgi:(2Fe-2S) ferredoxin
MEDPWDEEFWYREVKADAQRAVDDFLDQHRKQEPGPPDDD